MQAGCYSVLTNTLPADTAVACFGERVEAIGDEAECHDDQQKRTKGLEQEFLEGAIQPSSFAGIKLGGSYNQEDADDGEDDAKSGIAKATQID